MSWSFHQGEGGLFSEWVFKEYFCISKCEGGEKLKPGLMVRWSFHQRGGGRAPFL